MAVDQEEDGVAVALQHLLAIPPLSFLGWIVFIFLPTLNRPSRVNRIESVKETDVFSSKRLRKGEKRRCDSSFVTESIVGHVPSSSFPVWSRHMEMELFQPLNNTNQKFSSLFEKGKKERKSGVVFCSFSLPTI